MAVPFSSECHGVFKDVYMYIYIVLLLVLLAVVYFRLPKVRSFTNGRIQSSRH